PLFPAKPPEEQNERLLRGNRFDICSDFKIAMRGLVNSIRNDCNSRQMPAEPLEFRSFEMGCQMNGSGFLKVRLLDDLNPRGFSEPATPSDQIHDQHAPRREYVGNAGLARRTGGRPGGP